MTLKSKSVDIYELIDIKEGVAENGKDWKLAVLKNDKSYVNLFVAPEFFENVKSFKNEKVYIVTKYVNNYYKQTGKIYTNFQLAGLELAY